MGRGIDFKGVNLVINYDFPTSAVAYIHRIGMDCKFIDLTYVALPLLTKGSNVSANNCR